MPSKKVTPMPTVDGLLKTLVILSRTVDHTLGREAPKTALRRPLTGSKVQVLRLLGTRESQTATQIARFLGVTKPAVSQLVEALVRRKLVARRISGTDRREFDLRLTDKGQSAYEAVRREQRQMLRNALKLTTGVNATKCAKMVGDVGESLARAGAAFEQFCLQCSAYEDDTCVLAGGDAKCLFLESEKSKAKAPKQTTRQSAKRKKTRAARKT